MTEAETSFATGAVGSLAIVGMAGRFPGARSIEDYWALIHEGREAIQDVPEDRLVRAGIPEHIFRNRSYIRRAAPLADIENFDADYFGYSPRSAETTDPQHRLFLQTAWHALEDACCDPERFDGSIGVFASGAASGYLLHNLLSHNDTRDLILHGANIDLISLMIQNDKDYLATRVSHQFNLRGPSLTIQTACSSSLVAVHMACQSLLSGESDMALAGAASIRIPHGVGYTHERGSMVSGSGRCRPFDVKADGTVFGSGVGVVVLKRLDDAIAAEDTIHAVIAGSAVNNDGAQKIAFSAPNVVAQADVIAEAQAVAGMDAARVSYVEAHGTGTPLGDPIELEALRRAFGLSRQLRSAPCKLGSVKSNIGHLEVASGIAGLIKTVLCLRHRIIPATLHFGSPNPELRLEQSPFVIARERQPWEWDGPLVAGVSSFGVGGTNAHLIVTEPPRRTSAPKSSDEPQVLLLSAHTREAVTEVANTLAGHLGEHTELSTADVAHTLRSGRRAHRYRTAAVARGTASAPDALRRAASAARTLSASDTPVVLLFPGQGTQHHGMARDLLAEPIFAKHFSACARAFLDITGDDVRSVFHETDGADDRTRRTRYTQPGLFCVEYALAKTLEAYGVVAEALIGHSIGEYVAATLAGSADGRITSRRHARGRIKRVRSARGIDGRGGYGGHQ